MLDQIISLYQGVKDNSGTQTTVAEAIRIIGSAELKNTIELLRQATRPDTKELLKKKLPAVTWSGYFKPKRLDKDLQQHSGLICLDIDKLETNELQAAYAKICTDPYTYFCFLSPSGNGLKVLVPVPVLKEKHRAFFAALEQYYKQQYNIVVDPSGKNEARLCFLSFDPEAYHNPEAKTFELPAAAKLFIEEKPAATTTTEPAQPKEKPLNAAQAGALREADTLDSVKEFTDKIRSYEPFDASKPGSGRNEYVYLFARNCNRKGIDINDCLDYVCSFASDLVAEDTINNVSATVRSGYSRTDEHGKFKKGQSKAAKQQTTSSGKLPQKNIQFPAAGAVQKEYTQFWFEEIEETKTGKKKTLIEISYRLLMIFLSENGFHRLQINNSGYELVKFEGHVVRRVQSYQVRDFVVKWAAERDMWALEEKLRRGNKTYLSNDQINCLPFATVEFQKDTPTEAFFYYRNCWVRVTKYGITTHDYSELSKAIWATQINDRDFHKNEQWVLNFEKVEEWPCMYAQFMYYTAHNPKGDEPNDLQTIRGRFDAFCTAFGYLLHSYKNPSIAKMILAVDHRIGEKGEQNGGSGKSLAGKALAELKHTTNISGKDFKEDYPFKYEQITPDSQIVGFNDLRRNFNMECLFENITNDWVVNRRNIGYLLLPFESSPKIYASTNFIMGGEGSSFIRRMHIIEFSDYFNDEHTPFDEFGCTLFQDWDDEERNRFDNFMLQNCCALWLREGLVKYPGSNYEVRKLQSEVPEEFIDFLDQVDATGAYIIKRNVCHRKVELMDKFREFIKGSGLKEPTAHSFTKWTKAYCKTHAYLWNAHNNGKRDSSGPLGEFVSICDERFDQESCIASRGALFQK